MFSHNSLPWRRNWQPAPVFLPRESHGQRSLAGYNPWGHKESDTTKQLTHTHTHTHKALTLSSLVFIFLSFCHFDWVSSTALSSSNRRSASSSLLLKLPSVFFNSVTVLFSLWFLFGILPFSAEVLTVLIHFSLQFSENLYDYFLNSSSGKLVISISYSFIQDVPPWFFILLDSLCWFLHSI